MPMANDYSLHGRNIRTLIYGKDKTKKTWWACRAAEAGYNVILIDGDDGSSIVKQLPLEAQKKILVVDVVNQRDRAVFSLFMASFCRPDNEFLWDEQGKCSVGLKITKDPTHSYIHFAPKKFTSNDVIIIDSWTALAASTQLQWAQEQDVDLTAIEKEGDQFALLGFQSRFLDYCLNQLHTMPCHVIVVGHETVYEKWSGKGKDRKLEWQSIQPISSTGPQGMKLGKHFSDVLHFTKMGDLAYRIDAGADKDRSGGSRLLAPKKYNWDEVTPQLLFAAVGSKPTGDLNHGAIYLAPGATLELAKSSTTNSQAVSISQSANTPSTTEPVQPKVLDAGNAVSKLALLQSRKT